MEESILISIKKLLGIDKECTDFDLDILIHINTVFMVLNQLGVGPSEGFSIEDDSTTWSEYISDDMNFNSVKTFIHLKVKLLFDPPLNSSIIESINQSIKELEWRLNVQAEQNENEEV